MIDTAWEKELSWAAGFFDGEGHCGNGRGGYVQIMVTQRTREPLERFQAAFAVGSIYETTFRDKPLYHYCTHNLVDTRYVCDLLLSRVCSIKRDQINGAWAKRVALGTATYGSPEHHEKMRVAVRHRAKPRPKTADERARTSASHRLIERNAA